METTVTFGRSVEDATVRIRVVLPAPCPTDPADGVPEPAPSEVSVRWGPRAGGPATEHRWTVPAGEVTALRLNLGMLGHRVDARDPSYRLWVEARGQRPMAWRWPAEPEPLPLRRVRHQLERLGCVPLLRAMASCRRGMALAARTEDSSPAAEALRIALRALSEHTAPPEVADALPVSDAPPPGPHGYEAPDLTDLGQPALALVAALVADRIDDRIALLGLTPVLGGWRG